MTHLKVPCPACGERAVVGEDDQRQCEACGFAWEADEFTTGRHESEWEPVNGGYRRKKFLPSDDD